MNSQISSIFKKTLPACPACQAEIAADDRFCQECGSALELRADSAVLERTLGKSRLERLHPSLSKPVVALPLVSIALIAVGAISFFLVGFEKSYSGFSNQYVVDQARQACKENKFDEAATCLERLALNHKLDDDQLALLNDVYLARSAQRVQRLDYVGAMADLNRIPPQYSKFIVVNTRRNELNELIRARQAQQQLQSTLAAKNALRAEKSKLRFTATSTQAGAASTQAGTALASSLKSTAVKSPAAVSSSQTPDVIPATTSSSSSSSSTAASSSTVSAGSPSSAVVSDRAASGSIPESTLSKAAGEASHAGVTAQKANSRSKVAKITENDQVRYNELLAGYFSQEHKQSAGAMEPPSLKEWIESGRPKF
ncbi:MAG: hypothetical protein EKK48_06805 [Candidatus Melainabacteria bacterium]|nr:MAG: hypothetical protein EKK48_06805 [Candidatus Melainabacteria bacterium]